MKLITPVVAEKMPFKISLKDRICVLGSCFADGVGGKLGAAGFDVCINPFGTLYNPASVLKAVRRLSSRELFSEQDCVQMGAGAGLVCSFSHHTSFARPTSDEFLGNANSELEKAAEFWQSCNKVIITLGTAFVWEQKNGNVVSNCLKRPSSEFTHRMMNVDESAELLRCLVEENPEKKFIFTVSPIRHLGAEAHSNTLSKATLQLSVAKLMEAHPETVYFPAYEILLDELRDYRFYAEDLVHPSPLAVQLIWERFQEMSVPECEYASIRENLRSYKAALHRKMYEKE